MSVFSFLYRRKAWRDLRAAHLRLNPLCVKCNPPQPGNIVDHRIPHKGDMDLFFDPTNLQTLCGTHHSSDKQIEEARGFHGGASESGLPLDPRHPFHRGGVSEK